MAPWSVSTLMFQPQIEMHTHSTEAGELETRDLGDYELSLPLPLPLPLRLLLRLLLLLLLLRHH